MLNCALLSMLYCVTHYLSMIYWMSILSMFNCKYLLMLYWISHSRCLIVYLCWCSIVSHDFLSMMYCSSMFLFKNVPRGTQKIWIVHKSRETVWIVVVSPAVSVRIIRFPPNVLFCFVFSLLFALPFILFCVALVLFTTALFLLLWFVLFGCDLLLLFCFSSPHFVLRCFEFCFVFLWHSLKCSSEALSTHASNYPQTIAPTARMDRSESMFLASKSFNRYISKWDVSSVTNMPGMFRWATSFNRDISKWDVSSVDNMSGMFRWATSFNRDISKWDVSSVTNMHDTSS